jgi:hypothetical protein
MTISNIIRDFEKIFEINNLEKLIEEFFKDQPKIKV